MKYTRLPAALIVPLLCACLSGCALFDSPAPPPPERPLSPVREFMISHTPGTADAVGTVSDPEFGDNLRIALEQEFLSAAGETCRRASLTTRRGEAEMVVMCRNASGVWTMAPRVWGRGLPQPSAGSAPTPEPSAAPVQTAPAQPAPIPPSPDRIAPQAPAPDSGVETSAS